MEDPDVIARIDFHGPHDSQSPVVRQRLFGPGRVQLERRRLLRSVETGLPGADDLFVRLRLGVCDSRLAQQNVVGPPRGQSDYENGDSAATKSLGRAHTTCSIGASSCARVKAA